MKCVQTHGPTGARAAESDTASDTASDDASVLSSASEAPAHESAESTAGSSAAVIDAERLCTHIFSWVCQNCTSSNPVAPATAEMLGFAEICRLRLVAQRALNAATLAWSAKLGTVSEGGAHPPLPPPEILSLREALPFVPPPPHVPPRLLARQKCDECGVLYLRPSPSAAAAAAAGEALPSAEALFSPNLDLLVATMDDSEDGSEPGDGNGGFGAAEKDDDVGGGVFNDLFLGGGDLVNAIARVPARLAVLERLAAAGVTSDFIAASLAGDGEGVHGAIVGAGASVGAGGAGAASVGAVSKLAVGSGGGTSSAFTVNPTSVFSTGGFSPIVGFCYDERMLLHEEASRPAGRGGVGGQLGAALPGVTLPRCSHTPHPERPDRLRAIATHLAAVGLLTRCVRVRARDVRREELRTVHGDGFLDSVDALKSAVQEACGRFVLDGGDTFANEHTLDAARLAAGAVCAVTEEVMSGRIADRGLAIVRPPGHHAEPDLAMGFCVYNNVAVAAATALQSWGARRVLILDWDVHHGNGTEKMFYDDPRVLYVSIHRFDSGDFFPGTGAPSHVGDGAGAGYNVNIGWSSGGAGDAECV